MTKTHNATTKASEPTTWGNTVEVMMPLVVSILAFALGGGFVWNEFIDVPKLMYAALPAHNIGGQYLNVLVIENRGRATAHDVLVKATDLNTTIKSLGIETDEPATIQSGGEGKRNITIWLDRVTSGSTSTVYMLTDQSLSLDDHLSVTTEGGPGILIQSGEPESRLPLYITAAIAFIIGTGISWFLLNYSIYGQRKRALAMGASEARILRTMLKVEAAGKAEILRQLAAAAKDTPLEDSFTEAYQETLQEWTGPPSSSRQQET